MRVIYHNWSAMKQRPHPQILSAEVWHVANSKICTKAVDKTLKIFINESKSVKIHATSRISRKKANFMENVTSVKSWIRLVPGCQYELPCTSSVNPWNDVHDISYLAVNVLKGHHLVGCFGERGGVWPPRSNTLQGLWWNKQLLFLEYISGHV